MQFHLIRHFEPRGARGICYGRQDLPCDAECLAAGARALRERLPLRTLREGGLYTSPLSRCRELARVLAAPRRPSVAGELSEIDFGSWEGCAWDSLPRGELDAWACDVWHYRPGGGESAAMLEQRWRRWCATVETRADDAVIAVTHAGVIRAALAASGELPRDEAASARIGFGSVHVVGPPLREPRPQGIRARAAP